MTVGEAVAVAVSVIVAVAVAVLVAVGGSGVSLGSGVAVGASRESKLQALSKAQNSRAVIKMPKARYPPASRLLFVPANKALSPRNYSESSQVNYKAVPICAQKRQGALALGCGRLALDLSLLWG